MLNKIRQLVKPLASLKLTVVLMGLSLLLIFAGTWAQLEMGIWSTMKTYFRTFYVFVPLRIFFPRDWSVPGSLPFPGGYVLGGLLLGNLLAAHAVRFKLGARRVGIILIHLSLILLLVNELATALWANEANMTIREGQAVNFAVDHRESEMAILESVDEESDHLTAVPQSWLVAAAKNNTLISDSTLPFSIRVDAYYHNSQLLGPFQISKSDRPDRKPRATKGFAAKNGVIVESTPMVSGLESNIVDVPSALVTLFDQGRELGTWLLSRHLSGWETVDVNGKTYRFAVRFKRDYKPYSLQLIDFRFDRYLGTRTAMNYSSQVRLIDPVHHEDREVKISMNNPLRYRGETFFQASFTEDETSTILQVVRNPAWQLPYIACTIGAIGMLIHFGMQLVQFLGRRNP